MENSSLEQGEVDVGAPSCAFSKSLPFDPPELRDQSGGGASRPKTPDEDALAQIFAQLKTLSSAIECRTPIRSADDFPSHTITEAFQIYVDIICAGELKTKSPSQLVNWMKVKQRALNNFIKVCGNLPMSDLTRGHGRQFFQWWSVRVFPKDGSKPRHANTANKDIVNLQTFFMRYWDYYGDYERHNPFQKLRFRNVVYKDIPSFSENWIRTKILAPNALGGLNEEAKAILFAMIETGCRPSEIFNLQPEHIHLNHSVPHLKLRPESQRELKCQSAVRDIPLLGVSLQAIKRFPKGFPRYRDKGSALSATLNKAFRTHRLFPTKDHRIYSIRHSFENRMLEAGIDYGVRCKLMGHFESRPDYGTGGTLEYRQQELSKIVFKDIEIQW